jgi:hypothetical protein
MRSKMTTRKRNSTPADKPTRTQSTPTLLCQRLMLSVKSKKFVGSDAGLAGLDSYAKTSVPVAEHAVFNRWKNPGDLEL